MVTVWIPGVDSVDAILDFLSSVLCYYSTISVIAKRVDGREDS
jgi:hypothetical protein